MKRLIACFLVAVLAAMAVPMAAFAAEEKTLSDRLLAEWNFDDSTTADAVGEHDAVLYNDSTVASGTYVDGISGKALQLSTKGTDDKYWLSIPYDTLSENPNSFTISLWYNSTGHREVMLNSKVSYIGIGLARGTNHDGMPCWYCVQLFQYPVYPITWVDEPIL